MAVGFTALDWVILGGYVAIIAIAGVLATNSKMAKANDYFLAGNNVPIWLVAISVLSTSQSAATFLGAPDSSYRGDFTYLGSNIGAALGAMIVALVLMPRFYAMQATTVYELLEKRYDRTARLAAAGMYLVGRVLASGSRLYLAAIAVSMIMFGDIAPEHIVQASLLLLVFGLIFTFIGGLNAIIWSDLVQVAIYVTAALTVVVFLLMKIPASGVEIWQGLAHTPEGTNKLRLIDFSLDFSAPFSFWALITGVAILNACNFGLDQDTSQRLLACKDAKQGNQAMFVSVFATIPVVLIFMTIGSLLYVFYQRPDLMIQKGSQAVMTKFDGQDITVFMTFILTQMPPGLRGFVTVGVIAAAAVNSGLISMSSVLVQDFYRPWRDKRGPKPEAHYVRAGQLGMVVLGLALFAMSILCFYWQQYTDTPLLTFVLSVMTFAYSGLSGVYITAVFTKRGSTASVIAALVAGFVTILLQQAYIVDYFGLPPAWKSLAFPWQLCIGTTVAFLVCQLGQTKKPEPSPSVAV
ncbi:MAG: sodium:solute symporter [Alphaproteobacteria bacterium PA3]|nr:MAG: sodium:solute symporter [Alphaproteobacteria bacterium PA3]